MLFFFNLLVHCIGDALVRVRRYAIGMASVQWVAFGFVVAQMVADLEHLDLLQRMASVAELLLPLFASLKC